MKLYLRITLESDATFGRGEGVAGLVDEEVEYDPETGLPFLRGRALKGLLVEECSNILYALKKMESQVLDKMEKAAGFLFGFPGSTLHEDARMHVGAAQLPDKFCQEVKKQVKSKKRNYESISNNKGFLPQEVLESFTAIRRQTAVDEESGAPEKGSLRSMRVIIRDTTFFAPLDLAEEPDDCAKGLLAACVLSLRRAGLGRNRGRGRLKASLLDNEKKDLTETYFRHFRRLVGGEES